MSDSDSPVWRKWRELIGRRRKSGQSVAEFCRDNGVSAASFYAWSRRLREAGGGPAFVEAVVVPPAASASGSGATLDVRLRGGRRVRVGPGFDRRLLAEVVATLEAVPTAPEPAAPVPAAPVPTAPVPAARVSSAGPFARGRS
jgi:transposase-like protein